MTEFVIIQKPVQSMDWFLYDNGLRHERVKPALVKLSTWKNLKLTPNKQI